MWAESASGTDAAASLANSPAAVELVETCKVIRGLVDAFAVDPGDVTGAAAAGDKGAPGGGRASGSGGGGGGGGDGTNDDDVRANLDPADRHWRRQVLTLRFEAMMLLGSLYQVSMAGD